MSSIKQLRSIALLAGLVSAVAAGAVDGARPLAKRPRRKSQSRSRSVRPRLSDAFHDAAESVVMPTVVTIRTVISESCPCAW